nr:MAG TPA: hypothetical protein [Caudoviricetes sp.]
MQNGGIFGGILLFTDFSKHKNQLVMNKILVSPSKQSSLFRLLL